MLTFEPAVSKGFGLDPYNVDPLHDSRNMHKMVFDHLNERFPAPNGAVNGSSATGKNGFINGALGATGECEIRCLADDPPDTRRVMGCRDRRAVIGGFELRLTSLQVRTTGPCVSPSTSRKTWIWS